MRMCEIYIYKYIDVYYIVHRESCNNIRDISTVRIQDYIYFDSKK